MLLDMQAISKEKHVQVWNCSRFLRLASFAMMNHGVHWAGDYPPGFALGYGFGKFITKKNHIRVVSAL
jgi:hypothetical protein